MSQRACSLLLFAAACVAAACEPIEINLPPGAVDPADDRVEPPDDWAPPEVAAVEGPPVLYLDFEGAEVDRRDSFVIPPELGSVYVPPFDPEPYGVDDRDAAIDAVTKRVARHFRDYGVRVVHVPPAHGAYTVVLVGGGPELVGRPEGVAGIAPVDRGNRSPADVAFAFAGVLGEGRGQADLDALAAVIAHEAGHTYGLDHDVEPTSLMFPAVDDAMTGFVAAQRIDGQWQDAPALLRRALGAAARGGGVPEAPPGDDGPEAAHEAPSAGCGADPYEPNDTRDRAVEAGAGLSEARTCAGDDDWYSVELTAGADVVVRLEHRADAAFAAPEVFRPRGRTPLGEAASTTRETTTRFTAPVDGVYRVRVSADEAAASTYTLRVETAPR